MRKGRLLKSWTFCGQTSRALTGNQYRAAPTPVKCSGRGLIDVISARAKITLSSIFYREVLGTIWWSSWRRRRRIRRPPCSRLWSAIRGNSLPLWLRLWLVTGNSRRQSPMPPSSSNCKQVTSKYARPGWVSSHEIYILIMRRSLSWLCTDFTLVTDSRFWIQYWWAAMWVTLATWSIPRRASFCFIRREKRRAPF